MGGLLPSILCTSDTNITASCNFLCKIGNEAKVAADVAHTGVRTTVVLVVHMSVLVG